MSYLIQPDVVRYECTCGSLYPICDLFFCRHCSKHRCRYCVCQEVDSHYCSNCMEHLSLSEAKLLRNRCSNCFDCPNCFQPLSIRATTKSNEDGSSKTPTRHYYLACFFCRWTTRDVGIPDQTAASSNWPVQENPHEALLSSFLEHYKLIALREKNQKDKKSYGAARRGYSSYSEKYGLTAMIARKRAGLPSLPIGGKEDNLTNIPPLIPCEATEEVDPLPDSFFTTAPDLTQVTTLPQRLANPMVQPEDMSQLHPQRRHFFIKRSFRCRDCEHNVSKPEYNPSSIKFKIQLSAYYHMPEVKIMSLEPLKVGVKSEVILKLTNPTQYLTSVGFSELVKRDEEDLTWKSLKDYLKSEDSSEQESLKMGVARREAPVRVNSTFEVPPAPVVLPPRDDAAEYDEGGDTHNFQDDPKVVVWRKGNKAAVKFLVNPHKSLSVGTELVAGFTMEYSYIKTVPFEHKAPPQRTDIQISVFLSLGKVVGE